MEEFGVHRISPARTRISLFLRLALELVNIVPHYLGILHAAREPEAAVFVCGRRDIRRSGISGGLGGGITGGVTEHSAWI
jgi:hypothetical protein